MTAGIPDEIERIALLGWHVYPMSARSKAGAFKGAADGATCDLEQIDRWARDYPDCGWRVVAGPSELFILDVDRPGTHHADGFAALAALTAAHGPLPPRPMTRTGGSGGAALFFRHRGEPLRGESGRPAPGLDPHRGRQAIVIPPSRHPATGGAYTWRVPPWEIAPPPIPAWLATLLAPPPQRVSEHAWQPTDDRARLAVMRAMHGVQDAPPGQGNTTLNRQAYRLGAWCGAGLISEHEVRDALMHAASMRRIPQREAAATIRSGITAGMKQPITTRPAGAHRPSSDSARFAEARYITSRADTPCAATSRPADPLATTPRADTTTSRAAHGR